MMSIELMLCVAFGVAALPVSRSIAAHYAVFAITNAAMAGHEYADASLLAALFVLLAIGDAFLVIAGGRSILLLSAAISAALAIDSMLNQSYLLDQVTYISAALNAVFGLYLAREYRGWMRSR